MDETGWRWTLGQPIQWAGDILGHNELAPISRTVR
jgi:hypothetical protein